MSHQALIIVDPQVVFCFGSLCASGAPTAISNIVEKIEGFDGDIYVTLDTHDENYLNTREGRRLPIVHGIEGTEGYCIVEDIQSALNRSGNKVMYIKKPTFGSLELQRIIAEKGYQRVELVGFVTDICVISNAMLVKASVPEADIIVDASCCAGVTSESHEVALLAMEACQIDIERANHD